ncbi:MAG: hypothetical protein GDA67_08920 [Nitrospira sp. CR1.3]|nr:hypothetical protein [Nitrospira sp. CR1.3]
MIPSVTGVFFDHSGLSVKEHDLEIDQAVRGIAWLLSAKCLSSFVKMLRPEQTVRQRIMDLLTGTFRSSRQLAELSGISERQVEEHLGHIVKSVARDRSRRFMLQPSGCQNCGFLFRQRTRLTRPSRCPQCRNESISAPRYKIETG